MEVPTSQFWLSSCGNASNIEDSDLRHASYQNFTECFNKTILQWIPCVYMNITSPLYLLFLCQKNNVQSHSSVLLNLSKSVIICILAMISVADLYLTLQDLTESSLKPTLSLLSYILCILCIQFERIKSVRSAWVMFIFWLLSLCVQLVSVYSMVFTAKAYMPTLTFSKGIVLYSLIMTTIHLLAVLVELILSCVSDESCSQSHRKKERNGCPEEDAPFLSSISYWWFWPLIIKGCKKTLLTTDVWNLNIANQCTSILSVFTGKWMKEVKKSLEEQKCVQDDNEEWIEMDTLKDVINDVNFKASKKKQSHKPSLVKSLGQSFGSYYGVGSILQLIFDLMTFINPIILSLLIDFIDDKSRPNWFGFIYGGLMFVTSQFMSFLREQHEQRCLVTGMRVQAALIAAVYEKAFKLSNKARRRYSIGKIVNLVSVDAQKFIKLLNELNMLWSGPLQIAIAMYFLWKLLGPSTLGILAVMMVMLPLNAIIMRSLRNCRIKLMQYKDDRIKLTNEALSGIKILKLYAWEQSFIDRINEKRNQEILIMKKIAFLNSIVSFVWNCCPFVVCLGTFALFVLSSPENILDAKTAFVSLSLFNILRFPFFAFPWVVSLLVQVNVSVQRLSEFLTQEELGDNTVRQSSDLYDTALNITDASFSWDCNTFSLKDINLEIEKGLLVLIVGAVGAGKSSLISAILGEMKQSSGTLALNGSLAYVSQQSWIQNASLRNNVLFNHRIEPDLYWQTIKACALISDLDQLPAGDKTEIGEKGINLSGGQKQRVALARALYSKADIYLLDDPLSAVDVHVAKHIFENVIGPRGILADKTRLMVTHSLVHLPLADLIVVIGNGSITEIGTYNQLLNSSEFFSNNMGQYESSEFETLPRTAHSNSTGIIIPENYQSVALFNSNEQMSSYSDHSQLTSNNNGIVNSVEEDRLIQVESAETGTPMAYYLETAVLRLCHESVGEKKKRSHKLV
ncbi:multidrug resistance-associated protein 1-like isoform X2 [Tubulanus polymorphus]|uniref:multidrug resistance-associated protein 1-like isoform X2 n=1 Tax=Tubulanus polymorphus TaxID=672921 RepID=UPI003DA2237A